MTNINPGLWGKHAWAFMYYVAFGYPDTPSDKDKNAIKSFFFNLQNILPCDKCKNNFQANLQKYPLNDSILNNRDDLVKWVVTINNEVNKETNRPLTSYEEVTHKYLTFPNNECIIENNIWSVVIVSVFIVACLIIFLKCYSK